MNDFDPFDVTHDQQEATPLSKRGSAPTEHPQQIGRYRIEKVLGKGGFGLVYLAYDEQLDRLVAIKVPHGKLISQPEDAEAYLSEARTVANLEHPHIVPVFDVGSTAKCPCYVVSKYVEGTDLSTKIRESRLKYRDAAELVATVAEALHYAHKQGLVHRDVKPGNILIDGEGKPFVVDFGLALREENIGKGPKYAGTPAYMSPEQARGEGHRVDGRSDIFSLGIVFYELLAGRKPFRGDTQAELFEQVTSYEAKPLRQYDEKLPKELERICHKAMAKRGSERYSSAHDMAEDLRLFLQEQKVIQSGTSPGGVTLFTSSIQGSTQQPTLVGSAAASSMPMNLGSSDSQPIKIVPKGLRSFDAHDADFFSELLPGPRDRNGLPDSLRFWKTRIEETDPDNTFSVGLIYGPSGCGKSSLAKAGLLPRLSEDVTPIYIEATPHETESRLLHGLRKRCPALEDNLSLKDTMAALRRGQGIPVGGKVLIVLDQFEQWLYAHKEEENTDLVQALRQCDGSRVQCIVMVRDDFWMAVTRLLSELEVELTQGQNFAPVDLFPIRHAENVLAAFGRAFGTLPDIISEITKEQREFLKQSVAGLADEGKVICVRLALFADMMKGKTWTPSTLKEVGGTSGVGVTFLEEIFSSPSASPKHRLHQKAARAVLKDLLPDSGADIKGYMRSHAELMEASGYGSRPKDFDDLIRILDSEIRLITPTDPEGKDVNDESVTQTEAGQKYFQLTHDYLVHSLRDWLTHKQKETRKGRAELKLFDTAMTWNAKPENRFLPSWREHLTIRLLTVKKKWTGPQRKMMSKAGRVHSLRTALVAMLLVTASLVGINIRNSVIESNNITRAESLVESLLSAEITQVPAVVADLQAYREWADPLLQIKFKEAADGSPKKLHLAMALLPDDESQLGYLSQQLPVCATKQFPVLREVLLHYKDKMTETLWNLVQDDQNPPSQRFQAAAALAEYAPEDERWQEIAPFVAQHLTTSISSVNLGLWSSLYQPASERLVDSLTAIHANRNDSQKVRESAAFALSEYLRDQPGRLVDAVLISDEQSEFSPLIEALKTCAGAVKKQLLAEMRAAMPTKLGRANDKLSTEDQQYRDDHWKRQSLAAVTLVHLGFADDVWPLLVFTPNPSLRSFIIHHLGTLGTDHNTLATRLQLEEDDSIRRALIQSLGGLNVAIIPPADRKRIAEQLRTLYVNDPDSGIHSSTSWTLRQWSETLPELPIGEPTLSEEQRRKLAKIDEQIKEAKEKIAEERAKQIAEWGKEIFKKKQDLPSSAGDALLFNYEFDTLFAGENSKTPESTIQLNGDSKPQITHGVVGQAIELRGGAFATGDLLKIDTEEPCSIGGWFLFRESGKGAALLSNRDKDNRLQGIEIYHLSSGRLQFHLNGQTGYLACSTKDACSEPNCWYHIIATYDGSKTVEGMRIFVNGKDQAVTPNKGIRPVEAEIIESPVPLHFGTRPIGLFTFEPLNGAIDEVRFYGRPLTGTEIEQFYRYGIGKLATTSLSQHADETEKTLSMAMSELEQPIVREVSTALTADLAKLDNELLNITRRWYVNGQGQTMVVIPCPDNGDSVIDHSFAVSSHEVTVAEFRRFAPKLAIDLSLTPNDSCPAVSMTWYEAAAYCNWLSEQEGIPEEHWVYASNAVGEYAEGMKIKENYQVLSGYRLPSEQEWELACRAGTVETFCYGESLPLLQHVAWYAENSNGRTHSVGSLLPNELGLFDVHGNVYERTQAPTRGSAIPVQNGSICVLRGGAFMGRPRIIRIAYRLAYRTSYVTGDIGFRLARTYHISQ